MPIIGEHVEIERKPKLGGGGPGKIPHRRGYGGGDDGDRDRHGDFSSSRQRLRRGRIGVAIVIALVSVMFVALTVAYIGRLGSTGPYDSDHLRDAPNWKPLSLPYFQLWINSLLLVLSSIALELARRGMTRKVEFASMGIVPPERRGDFSWLTLTMVLGLAFLGGQLVAWNTVRAQGAFRRLYRTPWRPLGGRALGARLHGVRPLVSYEFRIPAHQCGNHSVVLALFGHPVVRDLCAAAFCKGLTSRQQAPPSSVACATDYAAISPGLAS
jgi:hypothetical protein